MGEQAAHMALRVLSGESVREVPMVTQSPNHFMFDGRALRRFNLETAQLHAHRPADLIKQVNDLLAETKSQGANRIVAG